MTDEQPPVEDLLADCRQRRNELLAELDRYRELVASLEARIRRLEGLA